MTELNAQPEGLKIPAELLGGVIDPELEEHIRDMIWMQLVRGDDDRLILLGRYKTRRRTGLLLLSMGRSYACDLLL